MPKTKTKIDYLAQLEKDMVLVEKGSFMMGSDEYENSQPIHKVTFEKDFYICKYPVTRGLWLAVMGKNLPEFIGDNRPVEITFWDNIIQDFLPKLNDLTKKKYRLPSEAEWEYSARGGRKGNQNLRFSGSNYLKEVGWYKKNSFGEPKPVGLKKENELGLYDMSGNIWEWCQDRWHSNYENAPKDGTFWTTGEDENRHVVRGGSWNENTNFCSSALFRIHDYTGYRDVSFGFRIAHD